LKVNMRECPTLREKIIIDRKKMREMHAPIERGMYLSGSFRPRTRCEIKRRIIPKIEPEITPKRE